MQKDDPRNIFYNQRQQYVDGEKNNSKTTDSRGNGTSNGTDSQKSQQQTTKNTQQINKSEYERKVEEMKRLAAKYEREGEGQLVKDIVNSVIEQKASGNLTNEQLLAFAKRISPMLNNEQRTRLNGLVEQLIKL